MVVLSAPERATRMKVVLVRFKDDERRDIALINETTMIGRRNDCALRIQAGDVSRQHCQISLTENEVIVKDLDSSNGIFVNGEHVEEMKLSAGDQLMIGPVVFVVQIDGQPESIEPIKPPRPEVAPTPDADATLTPEDLEDEDAVFELTADDFDLEDAISALDELKDEDDLP